MEQKFYICKHCGNIIAKVKDSGVPVVCCGEKMTEIVPGTASIGVGLETAMPIEVTVGGATIFVTNVERFEKL